MKSLLLFSFLFVQIWGNPLLDQSCPFDNPPSITCKCTPTTRVNIFHKIECQLGDVDTLPKFDSHPCQYSIDGQLVIRFVHPVAFYIQAKSFVDFVSIGQLILVSQSIDQPMSISWDAAALQGVRVRNFLMDNIYHFNSAFAALQSADENDLQSLELDSAGAYHLGGGDLKDFKKLSSFSISETGISTIDSTAFQGLEQVLTRLSLTDAEVDERLYPAVKNLQDLKQLNLSGNGFKSLDLSVFNGLNNLGQIDFSRNDQLTTLTISNIQQIPLSLNRITIKQSGLQTVDSKVGQNVLERPQFQLLDISGNTKLVCDKNVQWMAKYAFCPQPNVPLVIAGSQCSNLQQKTLEDYLKETVPNPCT